MRISLILLLILILISMASPIAQHDFIDSINAEEQPEINSSKINITEIKGDNVEENGFLTYKNFKITSPTYSRIEVNLNANQTWANNSINENKNLWNVPEYYEIKYSIYQFDVVESDSLRSIPTRYKDDQIIAELSTNNTYYFVYSVAGEKNYFMDTEGQCTGYYLSNPPEGYQSGENCIQESFIEQNYNITTFILAIMASIFVVFVIAYKMFHKIVLWYLNQKIKLITDSKNLDEDKLEELYYAMDSAYEGDYIQAFKNAKQI